MPVILSTSQVAEILGVSKRTLTNWKRLGANEALVGHGKWNFKKLLDWWLANIYNPADEESPDIKAERLRYERARATKLEMEVQKMQGELIPRADIAKLWAARVHEVKSGLLRLARKLPPRLEGLTKREMAAVIEDEVYDLLNRYARKGPYTPAPQKALRRRNGRT